MAKKKKSVRSNSVEGIFVLKILLYLLLGSMWLKFSHGDTVSLGLPVGFMIGLVFTTHEHFQIDRKIEYAVLLAAMLIGYFAPYGVYVNY
jgi:hypothetical protein